MPGTRGQRPINIFYYFTPSISSDDELFDVKDCVLFVFLFSTGLTLYHAGHTASQKMFVKMS